MPNLCSIRNISQHFPIHLFISGIAKAVRRVDITAVQALRVSYGVHPSSSYGLPPPSLPGTAKVLNGATPETRSDAILSSLTPAPVKAEIKMPVAMKDSVMLYYGLGLFSLVAPRLYPVRGSLHRLVLSRVASQRDRSWGPFFSAITPSLLKKLSTDKILSFISMRMIPNCNSLLIHLRLRLLWKNLTTASLTFTIGWLLIFLS